jgi:flagellar basal-body rod protein FlgG
MFDALYIGATGMRGEQTQIDTIAHNLANLNTVGYRRAVTSFEEISGALGVAAGTAAASAQGNAHGAGALAQVTLSSLNGELKVTGEPLDLAIDGAGFFEATRADGTLAYTRAGKMQVTADGLLALADGSVLTSQIEIPSDSQQVRIAGDGRVLVFTPDADEPVEVGRIDLVTFPNQGALQAIGDNLYVAPPAAGEARSANPGEAGLGAIRQGQLESSNVQLTDELVTMMLAQRAFEFNSRVVQAADQMMSITNSLYR